MLYRVEFGAPGEFKGYANGVKSILHIGNFKRNLNTKKEWFKKYHEEEIPKCKCTDMKNVRLTTIYDYYLDMLNPMPPHHLVIGDYLKSVDSSME